MKARPDPRQRHRGGYLSHHRHPGDAGRARRSDLPGLARTAPGAALRGAPVTAPRAPGWPARATGPTPGSGSPREAGRRPRPRVPRSRWAASTKGTLPRPRVSRAGRRRPSLRGRGRNPVRAHRPLPSLSGAPRPPRRPGPPRRGRAASGHPRLCCPVRARARCVRPAAGRRPRPARAGRGRQPRLLAHPSERALLDAMSWLPERVAGAARRGQPHVLAGSPGGLGAGTLAGRKPARRRGPARFRRGHRAGSSSRPGCSWPVPRGPALGTGLRLLGIAAPGRM